MVKKLFFSDQLDVLVDFLLQETESDAPLHPRTLLVPHPELKNWLMLKIAEKKGIAAGYQIFTVDELLCRTMPHRIVLFAQLYQALEKSQNTEIQSYLQCKAKKITELADTLTALFYSYGKEGLELQSEGWQEELYRQLFLRQPLQLSAPLHCFACHFLSEKTWHEILQVESVSLYLFSPCQHFWEDLSTHWEKKKLLQCANPLSRRQLQSYLEEAPPLLANWGKMGRETLKILDAYDFHIEESYTEEKGDSALSQLRRNLLTFERTPIAQDRSIAIFQTGSSPWREIEILKENIEHLAKQGTPFSDMVVLAPDIDSYVPFIEFVFSDAIPYRILDVEIGQRSHFLQGLYRLLAFQPEKALLLFETSSF
ncbi:MAG: exodeoxyribonuclease V subunit gamma, partial [Chlamydiia bacterium]|nr:exodeoxyribonuclease V subunit gamma [Chlamydiia bacterium]